MQLPLLPKGPARLRGIPHLKEGTDCKLESTVVTFQVFLDETDSADGVVLRVRIDRKVEANTVSVTPRTVHEAYHTVDEIKKLLHQELSPVAGAAAAGGGGGGGGGGAGGGAAARAAEDPKKPTEMKDVAALSPEDVASALELGGAPLQVAEAALRRKLTGRNMRDLLSLQPQTKRSEVLKRDLGCDGWITEQQVVGIFEGQSKVRVLKKKDPSYSRCRWRTAFRRLCTRIRIVLTVSLADGVPQTVHPYSRPTHGVAGGQGSADHVLTFLPASSTGGVAGGPILVLVLALAMWIVLLSVALISPAFGACRVVCDDWEMLEWGASLWIGWRAGGAAASAAPSPRPRPCGDPCIVSPPNSHLIWYHTHRVYP